MASSEYYIVCIARVLSSWKILQNDPIDWKGCLLGGPGPLFLVQYPWCYDLIPMIPVANAQGDLNDPPLNLQYPCPVGGQASSLWCTRSSTVRFLPRRCGEVRWVTIPLQMVTLFVSNRKALTSNHAIHLLYVPLVANCLCILCLFFCWSLTSRMFFIYFYLFFLFVVGVSWFLSLWQ